MRRTSGDSQPDLSLHISRDAADFHFPERTGLALGCVGLNSGDRLLFPENVFVFFLVFAIEW